MARPKSVEKQNAILEAAIEGIAASGDIASTKAIAAKVGIAEGTIFRYFPTKDALLDAALSHLTMKYRLAVELGRQTQTRSEASLPDEWNRYIDWGVAHPMESRALNRLLASDRISPQARRDVDALFPDFSQLCEQAATAVFRDKGDEFLNAVFFNLASTVTGFAALNPSLAEASKDTGLRMLLSAMRDTGTT